jgi:hypothetical protein
MRTALNQLLDDSLAVTIPQSSLQKNGRKLGRFLLSKHFGWLCLRQTNSNLWGVYRNSEFVGEKWEGDYPDQICIIRRL